MAPGSAPSNGTVASINMTPLIDVMLVLLVVLMVSVGWTAATGVEVELPKAASGTALAADPPLRIAVDREGRATVNGVAQDDRALAALAAGSVSRGAPRAEVLADGRARHADVVRVVDVLRGAGVRELSLGTEPLP